MSESEQVIEPVEVDQIVASAGQMLAQARAEAGMSVAEVSARLRLSVRQVNALETDDSAALPGDTFVRGFIRNYAKLLGLDPEPVLSAHRVAMPDAGAHVISLQSENILIISHDRKTWRSYLQASILVGVALAGWLAYMEYAANDHKKTPVENVEPAKPAAPVPAMPEPVAPKLLETPAAVPVEPEAPAAATKPPAAEAAAAVKAVATESAASTKLPGSEATRLPGKDVTKLPGKDAAKEPAKDAATVASQTAGSRLALTFTGQSWVSVTDHDGKEIFSKSQPAGSQAMVEGTPPFSVVIGNATGVQLTYHDKPVDLLPYTKGNVARLTLE